MYQELEGIDPEILQGIMCIFLSRYVLKAPRNRPRDPQRTYVCISPRYVSKLEEIDHEILQGHMCVYLPRNILQKLKEMSQEIPQGLLCRSSTKQPRAAWSSGLYT